MNADEEIPKDIKRWTRRLQKCFNEQPGDVWFFVSDGEINIMAFNEDGERVMDEWGGVDPSFRITSVKVRNMDGGDLDEKRIFC